MAWVISEGPVDARAGIPKGEGTGNFDGPVYRFRVQRDDGKSKAVWVRFRGTIVASNGGDQSQRTRDALATKGRSEIKGRLSDEDIPRCISFSGGPDPIDDDCPHPLSETMRDDEGDELSPLVMFAAGSSRC
jgi:hypothetical protein